jgi:hypothetical protein
MKCYICHRDESQIKNVITAMINNLNDTLRSLQETLDENTLDSYEKQCIADNGFTEENKNVLLSIDDKIKEISINGFRENKPFFISQAKDLAILYEYIEKQSIDIQKCHKINDLIMLFCAEPNEQRILELKGKLDNTISAIEAQKPEIEIALEKLQKDKIYLFETTIDFKHYEIPETQTIDYPSPNRWGSYDNSHSDEHKIEISHTLLKYCSEQLKKATKVKLCPICKALFADASYGALKYMRAQQEAEEDDDWGDEDDY